jgi:hypothetical protein
LNKITNPTSNIEWLNNEYNVMDYLLNNSFLETINYIFSRNIYNTSLSPSSNTTTQQTTYYYVAQSFTVQTAAYLTQVGAALNIFLAAIVMVFLFRSDKR